MSCERVPTSAGAPPELARAAVGHGRNPEFVSAAKLLPPVLSLRSVGPVVSHGDRATPILVLPSCLGSAYDLRIFLGRDQLGGDTAQDVTKSLDLPAPLDGGLAHAHTLKEAQCKNLASRRGESFRRGA